jgi:hypothetical protein
VKPNGRTWAALAVLAGTALMHAWVAFTIAAVVAAGLWLLRLRFYPKGPCRWCRGRRGRNRGSEPEQWGDCSHCDSRGERLRFGARWVNANVR